MKVAIRGASGFLGGALVQGLRGAGDDVVELPRNWQPKQLDGVDAVVNLAGEPIDQRWTKRAKAEILRSRVEGTRALSKAAGKRTFLNASAVGYYGDRGDETLDEDADPGDGFLADVCQQWEAAVESTGRVVYLRTGLVLGDGGALSKMLPPFRMGLGGRLGSGKQWMPWIHIDDWVGITLHALHRPDVQGPINLSADPVRNRDFTKALAAVLHRPAAVPVPAFGLRAMFGEMGPALLLASQRMVPAEARKTGYRFLHRDVGEALENLLV